MPLRAAFFDVGNTLVHLRLDRMAEAFAAEGVGREVEAIRAAERRARVRLDPIVAGRGTTEGLDVMQSYLRLILEEVGVRWDGRGPRLVERLRALGRVERLWSEPDPDARAVLAALRRRGLSVGVISNSDGTAEQSLRDAGLLDAVDFVLDSHLVGVEKPDRRIFQLALGRAAVAPAEAAFVGDLYSIDVLGARRAGMTGILLDPIGAWGERDCPRARDLVEFRDFVLARADA
ncbi:MAG: HAD-IA family hydrolase [candidate division NC10 bacterium]|nr:HAD-IA family hydrolase [candidate division NC10 bacterium]